MHRSNVSPRALEVSQDLLDRVCDILRLERDIRGAFQDTLRDIADNHAMRRLDAQSPLPKLQKRAISTLANSTERTLKHWTRVSPEVRQRLQGPVRNSTRHFHGLSVRALGSELEFIMRAAERLLEHDTSHAAAVEFGTELTVPGTSGRKLAPLVTAIRTWLYKLRSVEPMYWLEFESIAQASTESAPLRNWVEVEDDLARLREASSRYAISYKPPVGRPADIALEQSVFALMKVIRNISQHRTAGETDKPSHYDFGIAAGKNTEGNPQPRGLAATAIVVFLQGIGMKATKTAILNMITTTSTRTPTRLPYHSVVDAGLPVCAQGCV
jgi:hypothetical protein